MKKAIPDSKARTKALRSFILGVGIPNEAFTMCQPKGDGSLTVRFRSTTVESAYAYLERFSEALRGSGRVHECVLGGREFAGPRATVKLQEF